MVSLNNKSLKEIEISKELRKEVVKSILYNKWNNEFVEWKLGLLPSGREALFKKEVWDVKTAIRVVSALGIKFSINIVV